MHCTFRKATNVCIFLKGIWKPQRIPNPDFFEDKEPFRMTTVVGSKNKTNLDIEGGIRTSRVCFLQGGQISKQFELSEIEFLRHWTIGYSPFLSRLNIHCRPLVSTDILLAGCRSQSIHLYIADCRWF